jgi:hypothetical protein
MIVPAAYRSIIYGYSFASQPTKLRVIKTPWNLFYALQVFLLSIIITRFPLYLSKMFVRMCLLTITKIIIIFDIVSINTENFLCGLFFLESIALL